MKVGNTVRLLPGAIERNGVRHDRLVEGGLYVIQKVDDEGSVRLNGPATWVGKDDVEVIAQLPGLCSQEAMDREVAARKAAQLRVEELQAEIARLEPMRQRASDIERLTAERDEALGVMQDALKAMRCAQSRCAEMGAEMEVELAELKEVQRRVVELQEQVDRLERLGFEHTEALDG